MIVKPGPVRVSGWAGRSVFTMVELEIKKITAPDFTVSIRPRMPALLVLGEAAVPRSIGSRARHDSTVRDC
jgi:hypothetical protein